MGSSNTDRFLYATKHLPLTRTEVVPELLENIPEDTISIDLNKLLSLSGPKKKMEHLLQTLWAKRQRATALLLAVVLVVSILQAVINKPAQAQQTPSGASGKGLLIYSDNTTTPQKRQWNFGSSAFSTEAATTTWDDVYQTVTQASPTVKDFWVTGVADASGNLDVRTSTDGGATWTAGVTPTIGGTGTTRRFDIAFEQQSGDIVVMYSKNATTNEIGVRRYASGSWQSEVTFDPSATSNIITWIEMTEKPNSDELAVSYLTDTTAANISAGVWIGEVNSFSGWTTSYDTPEVAIKEMVIDATNSVLYAGSSASGIIYRCALSTSCDASGDWTTSYDTPESQIESLAIDTTNGVLYAGTYSGGIIYRCATSTACDASGDWTTSYDTSHTFVNSLFVDTSNGVLYAGTDGGIIYRCATSTGCDASGDWTTSYDSPEDYVTAMTMDTTNGVIYAATGNTNGIIYRCITSTSCDAAGDWTTSYDSPVVGISSLTIDIVNNVIYAGAEGGIIYRCALSTSCDASGDWTTSYDTSENTITAITLDPINNALYAGSTLEGIIYRCALSTSCDAAGDWTTSYDTPEGTIYSLTIDTSNGILYAGTGDSNGIIYRCNLSSGCGNSTFASSTFGSCDATTAVGDTKCFDINYETGSGRPVVNFGITAGVRFARWDGSAWSATKSVSTLADDGTMVDCDSDPSSGSTEIACISISNASEDVQGWIIRYVGSGGTGCSDAAYTCVIDANSEMSSHAAAAGRMFVGMTYVVSGGNRRAVGVSADAADDAGYDSLVYNGSTWTFTNIGITQAAASVNEENILAITNPYDRSEALIIHSDAAATRPDLWATKITLSGSTLSSGTDVTGNTTLEAEIVNAQGRAFDMAFEPAAPATKLTQDGYIWESDDGSAVDTNTQQAAGNGAISGVRKGERLTLRTQLKNTGPGYLNDNLGLFYDRGDGIWSKVKSKTPVLTAAGGCGASGDNTNYTCTTVDNDTDITGEDTSLVLDPSGTPWVSYYDSSATSLMVAKYVGSGGSGCGAS
ncbi:MAG: hypothetical protein V4702_01220, partial [Patescibacteria group bacterium]